MKPCNRIGLNVTKLCNAKCSQCFYLYEKDFNTNYNIPLEELKAQIIVAMNGGCKSVVLVGWGEPMLYPDLFRLLSFCNDHKMPLSIITNGLASIEKYELLYKEGLDHLHISMHGKGEMLDKVMGRNGAGKKQGELISWLSKSNLPWRSNTTVQKINYQMLPDLARYAMDNGCQHFVSLGYLPHYKTTEKVKDVAVHPSDLRRYIEESIGIVLSENKMITVRYHPMCHLKPEYWKYIVNAYYVVYDVFEWIYDDSWPNCSPLSHMKTANSLSNNVKIEGYPCNTCKLQIHCQGWNRDMSFAFDGAGLNPVLDIPKEYNKIIEKIGGLHDLNPANSHKGTFR